MRRTFLGVLLLCLLTGCSGSDSSSYEPSPSIEDGAGVVEFEMSVDETLKYHMTEWKVTEPDGLLLMKKPHWPGEEEAIYHTAARLVKGDVFRIIDNEYDSGGRTWWKVRILTGEYAHQTGYCANKWLDFCEKIGN